MAPYDSLPSPDPGTAERPGDLPRYVPPRVERLGTLAELTLGGDNVHDDGLGGAGDEGSV